MQRLGLLEFLKQIQTATGGAAEELKRLFPEREARNAVLALLVEDGERFAEILDAIGVAAGSTNTAFERTLANIDSLFRRALRTFQTIVVIIVDSLKPEIVAAGEAVKDFFQTFVDNREQVVSAARS